MDNQPTQPTSAPNDNQPPVDPAAPVYGGLPTPQPDAPIVPVVPAKKRSRKWLLLFGLPILFLGGGSVAAYYSYYQPRQTNKKVLEAIYNLADQGSFSSIKTTAELMQPGSSSPMLALDMTAGSDGQGNARADMDITYSALRLSGSMIARTDKTAYLKVNELPTLLSLADSYTGAGLSALGEIIGDKWIKLDIGTLDNSGLVSESQTAEANACVTAVQDLFGSGKQTFMDQIAKVYNQNSFLSAKKVGKEDVDGQSSTKYKLIVDKTKMANFLSSDQFDLPALESACGMSSDTATSDERQKLQNDINKLSVTDTYVWLTSGNKVAKIATKLAADETNMSMSMTFGSATLDANAPTDVITSDELLEQLQASMLSSLLSGSESDTQIPSEYLQGLDGLESL